MKRLLILVVGLSITACVVPGQAKIPLSTLTVAELVRTNSAALNPGTTQLVCSEGVDMCDAPTANLMGSRAWAKLVNYSSRSQHMVGGPSTASYLSVECVDGSCAGEEKELAAEVDREWRKHGAAALRREVKKYRESPMGVWSRMGAGRLITWYDANKFAETLSGQAAWHSYVTKAINRDRRVATLLALAAEGTDIAEGRKLLNDLKQADVAMLRDSGLPK